MNSDAWRIRNYVFRWKAAPVLVLFVLFPQINSVFAEGVDAKQIAITSNAPAATTPNQNAEPNAMATRMRHPVVNSKTAHNGNALLIALRNGGLVLYLRHAQIVQLAENCTVRNLGAFGIEQANQVGAAIKRLNIPIGRIYSSPLCRVIETVEQLNLGPFTITDDLSNENKHDGQDVHAARTKMLAVLPKPGENTLLVSHTHAGNRPEQAMDLDTCELIIFQPDGKGKSLAIGRIKYDAWAALS